MSESNEPVETNEQPLTKIIYDKYDREYRKKYNKLYYANNKQTIMLKLFEKVECPDCHRCITHQNLKKHKLKKICSNTVAFNLRLQLENIKI